MQIKKSFKPGIKATSYNMDRDHKTFNSAQKDILKRAKKNKLNEQTVAT